MIFYCAVGNINTACTDMRQLWFNSNVMLQYSNLNASPFGGVNSISAVKLPAQAKTIHGNARAS